MGIKIFQFVSDCNPSECVDIFIHEVLEEDHGFYVWPCSRVLANYIWKHRSRFHGKRVLELGSGTSLPGVLASKIGANTTLTDLSDNPSILANIRHICEINFVDCKVMGLNWGDFSSEVCKESAFDFILGSDVLFDSSDFAILFATVKFFLEKSPSNTATFITAYQHRSGHASLEYYMAYFGLQCIRITSSEEIIHDSENEAPIPTIYVVEMMSL